MTPALIMLVIPGLPSYNGVEVNYLKVLIGLPNCQLSLVFVTGDIYIFFFRGGGGGEGLIDDVIVIGWTNSDFKISRALLYTFPLFHQKKIYIYTCMWVLMRNSKQYLISTHNKFFMKKQEKYLSQHTVIPMKCIM